MSASALAGLIRAAIWARPASVSLPREAALASENVRKHLDAGTPLVGAYVPDRILSLTV